MTLGGVCQSSPGPEASALRLHAATLSSHSNGSNTYPPPRLRHFLLAPLINGELHLYGGPEFDILRVKIPNHAENAVTCHLQKIYRDLEKLLTKRAHNVVDKVLQHYSASKSDINSSVQLVVPPEFTDTRDLIAWLEVGSVKPLLHIASVLLDTKLVSREAAPPQNIKYASVVSLARRLEGIVTNQSTENGAKVQLNIILPGFPRSMGGDAVSPIKRDGEKPGIPETQSLLFLGALAGAMSTEGVDVCIKILCDGKLNLQSSQVSPPFIDRYSQAIKSLIGDLELSPLLEIVEPVSLAESQRDVFEYREKIIEAVFGEALPPELSNSSVLEITSKLRAAIAERLRSQLAYSGPVMLPEHPLKAQVLSYLTGEQVLELSLPVLRGGDDGLQVGDQFPAEQSHGSVLSRLPSSLCERIDAAITQIVGTHDNVQGTFFSHLESRLLCRGPVEMQEYWGESSEDQTSSYHAFYLQFFEQFIDHLAHKPNNGGDSLHSLALNVLAKSTDSTIWYLAQMVLNEVFDPCLLISAADSLPVGSYLRASVHMPGSRDDNDPIGQSKIRIAVGGPYTGDQAILPWQGVAELNPSNPLTFGLGFRGHLERRHALPVVGEGGDILFYIPRSFALKLLGVFPLTDFVSEKDSSPIDEIADTASTEFVGLEDKMRRVAEVLASILLVPEVLDNLRRNRQFFAGNREIYERLTKAKKKAIEMAATSLLGKEEISGRWAISETNSPWFLQSPPDGQEGDGMGRLSILLGDSERRLREQFPVISGILDNIISPPRALQPCEADQQRAAAERLRNSGVISTGTYREIMLAMGTGTLEEKISRLFDA